jgi:hypothetical protein
MGVIAATASAAALIPEREHSNKLSGLQHVMHRMTTLPLTLPTQLPARHPSACHTGCSSCPAGL